MNGVATPLGWNVRMLAFIYVFGICVVAAILFVAVNEIEPHRRLASALRIVIVAVGVAALLAHLMR